MKKVLTAVIFCAFALTGASFAQTPPSAGPAMSSPQMMQMHHKRHERHPEIMRAARKLRFAKRDLERAAHDFGGHRVKAIAAIDEALRELHEAMMYDKK
ncbi:MAG: hypothetical protein KGJ09_06085 [Candidatus Omnitrophica bacterium]|nr:hypothetical protein [Candidatus Omnitrophota bacterium]MDE2009630.1 hypothetical protein [Candidatus Omnitrophota bacterium]MDE2214442.1 hypothetical protein [Candidatus Omnitrophota bacterium]MDE2231582.1 hypothetical protein [Candidatus Omnitrophota bacterium]